MRRSNGLLGLIGLILLLFAAVRLLLPRAAWAIDNFYIAVHVVGGVLALIAYLSAGLENVRTFLGERSTKYGTSAVLGSVFFIAILAALNYLAARHHWRVDLTEASVYSLSPQSKSVVANLDQDLRLQAFVEGGVNPELRDLLDSYRYASSKVSFDLIDPDRQPELAQQHGITAYNTVRVAYGETATTVTQPSEETITNAIIKVTRGTQQTVCFIEGHGEPDIDGVQDPRGLSQVKEALTNENYQVKKVLLATLEKVPDDCALLVVAGPEKPYLSHELTALETYLKGGKPALFMLPPQRGADLVPVLAQWGVKVGDDLVVDQVVRLFQGPALGLSPLVEVYDPAHEITREFRERTMFPMTRSVGADGAKEGLAVTELVKTSPSSWAETDVNGIFQRREAVLDGADRKGPVSIAVAVEAKLKEMGVAENGTTRLAAFGSVEFADNRNLGGTFFNRDLVLNTVGWLVGQTDLLSIRPKSMRASRVQFSQEQGTAIFYLSVLVLPELLLLAGLAVWWRRE